MASSLGRRKLRCGANRAARWAGGCKSFAVGQSDPRQHAVVRPKSSVLRGTLLGALLFASAFGSACSTPDAPVGGQGTTPAQSRPASAAPAAVGEHDASAGPGGRASDASSCPTAIAGTTVRAVDTEGGAALELTTTGDVAAVRGRARKLAEHHAMHVDHGSAGRHGPGHMPGPAMGGHAMDGHAMGGHAMVDAEVTVRDIDRGARIALTPRVPTELEGLRAHAAHLAERLRVGDCAAAMTMM